MAATVPVPSPITASDQTGPLSTDSNTATLTVTFILSSVSGSGSPSITFTASRAALRQVTDPDNPTPGSVADPTYPPAAWDAGRSTAALTTPGTYAVELPPLPGGDGSNTPFWRLSWAVTGTTPSFDVTVTADS